MGLTPSAAAAADLLSMLPTACYRTYKSTKRVLLLFLLCAVIYNFGAVAMDGGAAAPGHAWTPGRHIVAVDGDAAPHLALAATCTELRRPEHVEECVVSSGVVQRRRILTDPNRAAGRGATRYTAASIN